MGQYTIEQLDALVDNIQITKENIKTSIEKKGVIVGDALLEDYPALIDEIVGGDVEPNKTQSVVSNGTVVVTPSEGYVAMEKVVLDVNVAREYTYKAGDNLLVGNTIYIFNHPDKIETCNINDQPFTPDKYYNISFNGIYNINCVLKSDQQPNELFKFTSLNNSPVINTSEKNDFSYMFYGSSMVNCSGIDTSSATNTSAMFANCFGLQTVKDLDMQNVINAQNMFSNCYSLYQIGPLNTNSCSQMQHIFSGCSNLKEINGFMFNALTSAPVLFDSSSNSAPVLNKFILNGVLNFSVLKSNNLLSRCVDELGYDTIKSWLTAASNTTNVGQKTLDFATSSNTSRSITDQEGELANLVESCTAKGWIIQNLDIL